MILAAIPVHVIAGPKLAAIAMRKSRQAQGRCCFHIYTPFSSQIGPCPYRRAFYARLILGTFKAVILGVSVENVRQFGGRCAVSIAAPVPFCPAVQLSMGHATLPPAPPSPLPPSPLMAISHRIAEMAFLFSFLFIAPLFCFVLSLSLSLSRSVSLFTASAFY